MGRKPLGDHRMTNAEKQARHRRRQGTLAERVTKLEQRVAALELQVDPELAALLGGGPLGLAAPPATVDLEKI